MIVLYGKNNCASCTAAKALLTSKGVEFHYINCDENFEAFDMMVEAGHRTFPQLYMHRRVLEGGYQGLLRLKEVDPNFDSLK